MNTNHCYKTKTTRKIRYFILKTSRWFETNNAEWGTTTLSYQSRDYPERNIWIETIDYENNNGTILIDLEDWNDDTHWDNSVIHFESRDYNIIVEIAKAWLGGESIEYCKTLGGIEIDLK